MQVSTRFKDSDEMLRRWHLPSLLIFGHLLHTSLLHNGFNWLCKKAILHASEIVLKLKQVSNSANTLAYYALVLLNTVKSFSEQAPEFYE
jgi:hypothetical protein